MMQWKKGFAACQDSQSHLNFLDPHGGKKEQTLDSCSLISTQAHSINVPIPTTHTYSFSKKRNSQAWCNQVTPELGRLRHGNSKFKVAWAT